MELNDWLSVLMFAALLYIWFVKTDREKCPHCGKYSDERVKYERDGIKRDGSHVMVGTPSPLSPDWKPAGRSKAGYHTENEE